MKAVVCNSDFGVKASDRHVCSTDQLHMFTSVSFAIFTSLHLRNSAHIIFISSQLLILTSANLHIFSLSSADLHIFTSSLSLSLTPHISLFLMKVIHTPVAMLLFALRPSVI